MHIPRPIASLALTLTLAGTLTAPARAQSSTEQIWLPMVMQQRITDLGTLPGDARSTAYAINNQGQVTGVSLGRDSDQQAFLWTPGQGMIELGPNDISSEGSDVNDQGHVVGVINPESFDRRAFFWTPAGGCTTWEHWAAVVALPTPSTIRIR